MKKSSVPSKSPYTSSVEIWWKRNAAFFPSGPLPVYGKGEQIRDWLYVEDHARALYLVATTATPGKTYNIGGHNERRNIDVVKTTISAEMKSYHLVL